MAMFLPSVAHGREDELAGILEKCLLREMNSPDSIEYNLALLEKAREGKEGVQKALYTACLAQLYSMRAYSDATGEWRKRSKELFIEALSNPKLLYDAKTKEYLVEGPRIERMLGYTNLESEKGFAFFQKFLVDNGIIDELKRLGCKEGDTVRLYGHGFEFFD